jgi:NADH-quinone oxidoreductase subunit G
MHPLEDALLQNVVTQFVKYEAGSEEGVMAMLAKTLLADADLSDEFRGFFNELDEGYLCAESNAGDEEFTRIEKSLRRMKRKTLVIGSDVLTHERAENIARLAALVEVYTDFSLVVVPQNVNTVGVSLVCELDQDERIGNVVGYNANGDFVIGAMSECDLMVPAMNSQEGTFVSLNYQLLPTNVAIGFEGYCLNDLANALGLRTVNTIDYTAQLPKSKGFNGTAFDKLGNFYGSLGEDNRGYMLETIDVLVDGVLENIAPLPEFNGTVVYRCNPVNQFNIYTARTSQLERDTALRGSAQFAAAARISDGDQVEVQSNGSVEIRTFVVDESLKGTIALSPTFDTKFGAINESYRFEKIKIMRVGS